MNERLNKGANYFITELDKVKQTILTSPLLTESKEAGRDVGGILEEMFRIVHTKVHHLSSCQKEFVLQDYVRIKSTLKIPEFKATVYAVKQKIIDANPKVVADYKGGKEQALMSLVGQIMKETKGSANPAVTKQILIDVLARP